MRSPRARTIVYDAGALPAAAESIDSLARMGLETRRAGAELRLRNLSPELAELLALAGLSGVLGVEVERQPKEGEEGGGVQEEGELGDPPL